MTTPTDGHDEPVWVQPSRVEILTQVRDILVEHPERHRQSVWISNVFGTVSGLHVEDIRPMAVRDLPAHPRDETSPVCGTVGCIAGWTVVVGEAPGAMFQGDAGVILADGRFEIISTVAKELLQLSDQQANWLFDGARNREQLIDALNALIEDPAAEIWNLRHVTPPPVTRTMTVTVTDESGDEMWQRRFTVTRVLTDADDWDFAEEALRMAHRSH